MATLKANPKNVHEQARKLRPGDTLLLDDCRFESPVYLEGLGGTAEHPITISSIGGAVFTSGEEFKTVRKRINEDVYRRQQAGYYPSIGQTADESWLILRNCRYVELEKLRFEACWPGAIYIDDGQHITIRGVHFQEGTIAIGANGGSTRDLLIEDCYWQQDTSDDHIMWRKILWWQIHGHTDDQKEHEAKKVDIVNDYRLWDGDFFRAWEIAGNVTIRNNTVTDAFNAIHMFNRRCHKKQFALETGEEIAGGPNGTTNVLIENNTFIRVRDNVIEPEEAAWNWVVRHNAFLDCYRWFSFEMQYGGYIYVYGNVGWDHEIPGEGNGGSVFKFSNDATVGIGPFYVFHNSWRLHSRIMSKNSVRNFHMFNNAVEFSSHNPTGMFGKHGKISYEKQIVDDKNKLFLQNHAKLEKVRFTVRWTELNITCDGDIVHHKDFPEIYNGIGMQFGDNCSNKSPGFVGGKDETFPFKSFVSNLARDSIPFNLELPYGDAIKIPKDIALRGAVQVDGRKYQLPKEFGWIETDSKAMLVSKDDSGAGKKPKPA